MKVKRAAIYARVSTHNGRTPENQLMELREVAARAGWFVTEEYVDRGISGAKGRDKRVAFDALCQAVTQRKVDVVMAWSVDRLGRSLKDLIGFLGDVHAVGGDVYLHRQGIDTTTPGGKMLFQVMGAFAEFERELIRERIHAGLARARKGGTRSGRAIGRPRVSLKVEMAIQAARAQGKGYNKIAREVGVGSGTVRRVLTEKPTTTLV